MRVGSWFVLIISVSLACAQTAAPPQTVKQGGVVRIGAEPSAATARMEDRTIRLFPQAHGVVSGLMPIPADQKPGPYRIELLDAKGKVVSSLNITVLDAHFRKQNVTIEPSVASLAPSPGESEQATAFRKNVSDVQYWSEPFIEPVRGCMTSPYGVQRYMNGKPTGNIHAGLDLRAPSGTPVRATADGVVRVTREWAIHGNTVGIDHGQGLESMYNHLSKFAVQEGAAVKKGDVIGYSGSTGRSNAPHLHWTLYVNGVPVNPLEWVKVSPCTPAAAKPRTKNGRHGAPPPQLPDLY